MIRLRLIGGPGSDDIVFLEQGASRELFVPYTNQDTTPCWVVPALLDPLKGNIKVARYRVFPKFKTAVYQGDQ